MGSPFTTPHCSRMRGFEQHHLVYCQPFEFQPVWRVCGNVVMLEIVDHPSSGVRGAWWQGFPERSFGAGRLAWRWYSCMARAGRGRAPEQPPTLPPGSPVVRRGWPDPGPGLAGGSARVAGCPEGEDFGDSVGSPRRWQPHTVSSSEWWPCAKRASEELGRCRNHRGRDASRQPSVCV